MFYGHTKPIFLSKIQVKRSFGDLSSIVYVLDVKIELWYPMPGCIEPMYKNQS